MKTEEEINKEAQIAAEPEYDSEVPAEAQYMDNQLNK